MSAALLVLAVLLVLVGGPLALGIWLANRASARREGRFFAFTARFAGSDGRTPAGRPKSTIRVRGHQMTVSQIDVATRGTSLWSGCHLPLGDETFRFELLEQRGTFTKTLWDAVGAQDIEFGDEPFDHRFIVRSNDESRLRRMLTPDIRRRLVTTAETGVPFVLRVHDGTLAFQMSGSFDGGTFDQRFEFALHTCAAIADAVKATRR